MNGGDNGNNQHTPAQQSHTQGQAPHTTQPPSTLRPGTNKVDNTSKHKADTLTAALDVQRRRASVMKEQFAMQERLLEKLNTPGLSETERQQIQSTIEMVVNLIAVETQRSKETLSKISAETQAKKTSPRTRRRQLEDRVRQLTSSIEEIDGEEEGASGVEAAKQTVGEDPTTLADTQHEADAEQAQKANPSAVGGGQQVTGGSIERKEAVADSPDWLRIAELPTTLLKPSSLKSLLSNLGTVADIVMGKDEAGAPLAFVRMGNKSATAAVHSKLPRITPKPVIVQYVTAPPPST
eukprot:c19124_g1_i1.p1 GENE.c19124_g1_i1~~c19124_g1_i1.p1  ORF type:complete len:310 (+),score=65.74 c19124_g1_i1:48-932(+)